MDKRRKTITVYRNGEKLGKLTAGEIEEKFGIMRQTVRKYAKARKMYKREYLFEYPPEYYSADHGPKKKKANEEGSHVKSLAEAECEARAGNMTYGQMQAEQYRRQVKVEHRPGLTSMRERGMAAQQETEDTEMGNMTIKDIIDKVRGGDIEVTVRDAEKNRLILTAPDDSVAWENPVGGYLVDMIIVPAAASMTVFAKPVGDTKAR